MIVSGVTIAGLAVGRTDAVAELRDLQRGPVEFAQGRNKTSNNAGLAYTPRMSANHDDGHDSILAGLGGLHELLSLESAAALKIEKSVRMVTLASFDLPLEQQGASDEFLRETARRASPWPDYRRACSGFIDRDCACVALGVCDNQTCELPNTMEGGRRPGCAGDRVCRSAISGLKAPGSCVFHISSSSRMPFHPGMPDGPMPFSMIHFS